MSERTFVVDIAERGSPDRARVEATGVIVLAEVARGQFQLSLRGVGMPDIVMACAQFMKYATELHPGFPDALEVAVRNIDALPSIGKIFSHGKEI